jgi:tetratricopeptide (TPR) repeat protein
MIFSGWMLQGRLKKALDQLNCAMYEPASKELKALLKSLPKEQKEHRDVLFYFAECLMAMGDEKVRAGDPSGALRDFEEAAALQVEYPDLFYRIGRICVVLGKYGRAEGNFRQAIAMNSRYLDARLALAELYGRTGRYEAAIKECNSIHEQVRVCDEEKYAEAMRLVDEGAPERGLALLQRTFQEQPDRTKALLQQGKRLFQEHDYQGAIRSFHELLEAHPEFPDVYNLLGVAYCGDKSYREAEESFQRAMELHPAFLDPRLNLAFLYIQMAQNKKAIKAFKEVLSIDPDNVIAIEGLKRLQM